MPARLAAPRREHLRLRKLLAALHLAHPHLPPYEFHFAGRVENGAQEYAAKLRRLGRHLPLVWRGELPGTAEFLQELDLFVMISEPAGCPNASLEAMAAEGRYCRDVY